MSSKNSDNEFYCSDDISKLEFIKIEQYIHSKNNFSFTINGVEFYSLKTCLIVGSRWQSILPIKDGICNIIFEESYRYKHTKDMRFESYLSGLTCDIEFLEYAVPLYPMWSNNLWHFVFESFEAIILLEKHHYDGIYIVPNEKYIIELLQLLGIKNERIRFPSKKYVINNTIIPKLSSVSRNRNIKDTSNLIRCTILDMVGVLKGKKFTYIKRMQSRKINNEEEMNYLLKKYNFETIIPEDYSIKTQFNIMTNSIFSIMPHGANTTLTITQPAKSVFIECFPFSYVNYTNMHIIDLLKLLYIPIPETINSDRIIKNFSDNNMPLNSQDMYVNIKLLDIIKNILSIDRKKTPLSLARRLSTCSITNFLRKVWD